MIKTELGEIVIKGITLEILADMALIVRSVHESLVENGYDDKRAMKYIQNAINAAFKATDNKYANYSDEELDKIIGAMLGGNVAEKEKDDVLHR